MLAIQTYAQTPTDKLNIQMAKTALDNNDYERAQKYLDLVGAEGKDDVEYNLLTAQIYENFKRYDEAKAIYEKLYQLTGNESLLTKIARLSYDSEVLKSKQDKKANIEELLKECPKLFSSMTSSIRRSNNIYFKMEDGKQLKYQLVVNPSINDFAIKIGSHTMKHKFEFVENGKPVKTCLGKNEKKIIYHMNDGKGEPQLISQIDHKACAPDWGTFYAVNGVTKDQYAVRWEITGKGNDPVIGRDKTEIVYESYSGNRRLTGVEFKTPEYNEKGTISKEDAEALHKICHCAALPTQW